jgi:predicted metal-dependent hydrolase
MGGFWSRSGPNPFTINVLQRLARVRHIGGVKTPPTETMPLSGTNATVTWRRSARARRITLRIDATNAQVIVTLPMRAGQAAGRALLAKNADWVADRLAAIPDRLLLTDGASVVLDGVAHPIRHVPGGRGGAWVADGALHVSGDAAFLPRRAADFLRGEARRRFGAQALAKAEAAGLRIKRVTVKDTRTRWGSCSPDGVLMFCWRLIMAPPHVQDYVVAHEVAHLRHMNHGADFWALAESLSPHRDLATAWLHQEGAGLLRIG